MKSEAVDRSASLCDTARALARGELTALQITTRCLARIDTWQPQLLPFVELLRESACTQAGQADAERAAGHPRGPLQGIPIGLKDVIHQAGVPTRAQSRLMARYTPITDAPLVAKLRAQGAVLMGKLATHEFAFGTAEDNPPYAPARNPWDPTRFAGGSSSGAAVATATGMVLGALATDTAGSVRSPAALCGVVGFKPGRARLDRSGILPLSHTLDTAGVIAPTVEDAALLYAQLLESDTPVPWLGADGLPALASDFRGLRVGLLRNFHETDAPISAPGLQALDDAVDAFRHLGCTVRDVTLPSLHDWHAAGMMLLLAEAFALHERHLRDRPHLYGASVRDALLLGAAISAADYLQAQSAAQALTRCIDGAFEHVDVLLTAIQPGEAPRLDQLDTWSFIERPSYGLPFNVADLPALTVPAGCGSGGLPLAIQLVGARGDESTVLAIGHAIEQLLRPRHR